MKAARGRQPEGTDVDGVHAGPRTWIVRLLADDGTAIDGRLDVEAEQLTFRPGARGALAPAITVPRARVSRAELLARGLGHHILVELDDGRRLVFDNGVVPVDGLAAALGLRAG